MASEFERMKKESDEASDFLTKHVLEIAGLNKRPNYFEPKRYYHLK